MEPSSSTSSGSSLPQPASASCTCPDLVERGLYQPRPPTTPLSRRQGLVPPAQGGIRTNNSIIGKVKSRPGRVLALATIGLVCYVAPSFTRNSSACIGTKPGPSSDIAAVESEDEAYLIQGADWLFLGQTGEMPNDSRRRFSRKSDPNAASADDDDPLQAISGRPSCDDEEAKEDSFFPNLGLQHRLEKVFGDDGSRWGIFLVGCVPASFVLRGILGDNLAPKRASWSLVIGIFTAFIFFCIFFSRVVPRGEVSTALWSGFFSGAFHALAGPDHLACLTPLALGRAPAAAAMLGALWGLGHGASSVILCAVCVWLKGAVGTLNSVLEPLSTGLVGMTLLIIGVVGLREQNEDEEDEDDEDERKEEASPRPLARSETENQDSETSDGAARPSASPRSSPRSEGKADGPEPMRREISRKETSKKRIAGVLMTGLFYGFTPDSLLLVAPGLGLGSQAATVTFFLSNVVGTALSMGVYAFTLALIGEKYPALARGVGIASSVFALLFGFSFLLSTFVGEKSTAPPAPALLFPTN